MSKLLSLVLLAVSGTYAAELADLVGPYAQCESHLYRGGNKFDGRQGGGIGYDGNVRLFFADQAPMYRLTIHFTV